MEDEDESKTSENGITEKEIETEIYQFLKNVC